MKLWLDDTRMMPDSFTHHALSVNHAKELIVKAENIGEKVELISCDHDLGNYANDGGDGIKLLDWLIERETFYPIKLHTANPVGRMNMERTINRYWK